MMSAFPDYGKAPPEYLLTMTELIAGYPENIQQHICDPRSGIASRENFLPSVKKIIDFAQEVITASKFRHQVVVYEDTPAWYAWKKHRNGRLSAIDIKDDSGRVHRGWYFPSAFPE
jgi:hypothetical protein